ncbi:hypothetical protein [Photobacterium profundum]|uniref:Uncharacterized protein n=1 Tax=Photobacterium profundum (strain SS9) TaxID=298386 RepID=Q6LSD3_PHOPR|nr:hypothetical protein [Photobacterium profundum]CAG19793.1 hypothetical protein PBPRA1382 [Photobacterium profundum SS9]
MPKSKEITQVQAWIQLLNTLETTPRLIGVLTSPLSLTKRFMAKLQKNDLMSFSHTSHLDIQLLAETIAASACDTLICDRENYPLLQPILLLQRQPMTIILNQECWSPDWCWQYPQHHFLCQQDLV